MGIKWLLYAVISLVSYAGSDLLGKKYSDTAGELAPAKLLASVNALAFVSGLVIYAVRLGVGARAPWQLIAEHPLILVSVLCYVLHWLFFLLSMRFIGLSMSEAVQSSFGVFYFLGIIAVNLLTGRLSGVREILHPLKLIPVVLVIVFTFLLPNTEILSLRKSGNIPIGAKHTRRRLIAGFILLLAATIFDTLDTICAAVILDEGGIKPVDYMEAGYFAQLLPCVLMCIYIMVKGRKRFVPFIDCSRYSFTYAVVSMLSSVFYLLACSYDAVGTGILFIAYPIVPILGAKLFLKERYTPWQNVCIWTITISAIMFCLADYIS